MSRALEVQPGARLPLPPIVIIGIAFGAAPAVGAAMAFAPRLGIALVVGLCYLPLVLINVRLGIVLWLPSVALYGYAALDVGPSLAGILILSAWIGAFALLRSSVPEMIVEHRRVLLAVGAMLLWILVSTAWAVNPDPGSEIVINWLVAGAIVLVISTLITDRRYVRLAAGALVAGAVVSVALGFAGAVQGGTSRIVGGSGDPNFLAAGIVPAIVLALALAAGSRHPALRFAVLPIVALLVIGLVGTQSRGGLIAAGVAAATALVLAKRQRKWVIIGLLWMVGAALAWFVADPGAWERMTDFEESNGRSELWSVAWQMWQDHPVVGVGLDAFRDNAAQYSRELGPLKFADFLTEQPKFVHNSFLELLAETGIIGLVLFLSVVAGCLACAWQAAGLFERLGDTAMAGLSRGVVVAMLAILTAGMFISGQTDRRMWVVLALGPALWAAAKREATTRTTSLRETGQRAPARPPLAEPVPVHLRPSAVTIPSGRQAVRSERRQTP